MSYDRIDRFLRNNLGDDDYAEYSAALDSLCTPQCKPLTDEELVDVASNCGMNGLNIHGYTFARAIEAAHGIKE